MTSQLAPIAADRPPVSAPATPLPRPTETAVRGYDLVMLMTAAAIGVVLTWVRHGGVSALTGPAVARWTSLAQITGLLASAAGLAGLVLVCRPRALDQRYGLDRLFIWHRYLGEAMAVLVIAHVATSLVAWSADLGYGAALRELTGKTPYMAGATVGALLVLVVTVSSLRSIRRRLSYETWYFVHLLAYAGLGLSFLHEVVIGGDFTTDVVARTYWIGLHLVVLFGLLFTRFANLAASLSSPLEVAAVTEVGPHTVELRLNGRNLRKINADAGQFFVLRPYRRGLWWQAHPFSLSQAPTHDGLTFTIKSRGDASDELTRLPLGTKVAVEGPYGASTAETVHGQPLLFVVGGVGVAPVRAILERMDATSRPVVLYRARKPEDLVHLAELEALTERLGGSVKTLVGPTISLKVKDPFAPEVLRTVVADVAERTAILCGPDSLVQSARKGLLACGVARANIHYERSWW